MPTKRLKDLKDRLYLESFFNCYLAESDMAKLEAEKMAEAAAQKAERLAQDVEKIAKKVAKDAEEFVRNKSRLGSCSPHGHSDNHDGRDPAPATTYHHYHHGQTAATETSTTTITSTTLATSITTITYTALISSTTAVASTTAPSRNVTTTLSAEELFGYMATVRFWVLALLLLINTMIMAALPRIDEPKTKSSTGSKQHAPSLGHELDLTSLKSCLKTRSRQIVAVVLCRLFMGLYLLQSYWILDTLLRTSWMLLGKALKESNHWFAIFMILVAVFNVVFSGGVTGICLYLALDQQLTLDGLLTLLSVDGTVSSGPVRGDEEQSRHGAHDAREQAGMDEISVESGSEGDWEKDGF